MVAQQDPNLFHITIGVSPQQSLNLERELALLKAALLYADQVKYCSISASILILGRMIGELSGEQLLALYIDSVPEREKSRLKGVVAEYEKMQRKTYRTRTKPELIALTQIKNAFRKAERQAREYFEKLATDAGLDTLAEASQSGFLEVQLIGGSTTEETVYQFFDLVAKAVLSGQTYPLFDRETGNLIREAIREGKLAPSAVHADRAKQVALSSNLLSRLPLLDDVPVDVVLAVRKELDKPLIRFRSAMIQFSREVENAAWEKESSLEAERVYREYVEPAVLDIKGELDSNRFWRSLLPRALTQPVAPVGGSVLGLSLGSAANLPLEVATGLGLTAGVAANVLSHYQDWKAKDEEIKRNQLYFYYQAGQRFENT